MAMDGLVQSAELRAIENQSEEKLPEVIIHKNGVDPELENALNGRSSIVNSPDSAAEFMQNDSLVLSNPSLVSDFKQKVDLSWENINVEVELPKPSFLKRCFNKSDEPTKPAFKQILFDGNYFLILYRLIFRNKVTNYNAANCLRNQSSLKMLGMLGDSCKFHIYLQSSAYNLFG